MAPKLGALNAIITRVIQDPHRIIARGQYINQQVVYIVSPSKFNLCVVLVSPAENITIPLTSWILTDEQSKVIRSGNATLGKNGAIADYGSLLYSIHHCDDHHELQTLADEYLELYTKLGENLRYHHDEEKALSDFFCECDSYSPDDDEIWNTEEARTCINSTQLREAAGNTVGQLEIYA